MSLGSLMPFRMPNKNIRQCHGGQRKVFLPIESQQQHNSSKTVHDAHLPTMHPQILELLFCLMVDLHLHACHLHVDLDLDSCISRTM